MAPMYQSFLGSLFKRAKVPPPIQGKAPECVLTSSGSSLTITFTYLPIAIQAKELNHSQNLSK